MGSVQDGVDVWHVDVEAPAREIAAVEDVLANDLLPVPTARDHDPPVAPIQSQLRYPELDHAPAFRQQDAIDFETAERAPWEEDAGYAGGEIVLGEKEVDEPCTPVDEESGETQE